MPWSLIDHKSFPIIPFLLNIIVYGGASIDSSLIEENLIDEFCLFVNPVAIGNEKTIFKDLKEIRKYTLMESTAVDSGTVLLHYEVNRN